jgi:hypothetical protein
MFNEEELEDIKTQTALNKQAICNHDNILKNISDDMKQIKEKLLGRPSWIVVAYLSGISTLCGILITFILSKHG